MYNQIQQDNNKIKSKILKTKKLNIWNKNIQCSVIYKDILIYGYYNELKFIKLINNYEEIKSLQIHNNDIKCLNIYKDYLFSSSSNEIKIIDLTNNYEEIKFLKIHKMEIKNLLIYKENLISNTSYNIKVTKISNYQELNSESKYPRIWLVYNYKDLLFIALYESIVIIDLLDNFKEIKIIKYKIWKDSFKELLVYENKLILFFSSKQTMLFDLNKEYEKLDTNFLIDFNCLLLFENLLIIGKNNLISIIDISQDFKNMKDLEIEVHDKQIVIFLIFENVLISISNDLIIYLLDLKNDFNLIKKIQLKKEVSNNFILYKNNLILGCYKKLKIYSMFNMQENNTIYLHEDKINNFIIYNNWLITISVGNIKILENYKEIKSYNSNLRIDDLKTYNNKLILITYDMIKILDLINNLNELGTINISHTISSIIFNNFLILGTKIGYLNIIDLINENKILNKIKIHSESKNYWLFYKNLLITASDDKTIKILNILEEYKIIKSLEYHKKYVIKWIVFKNFLISISEDKIIFTDLPNFNKLFKLKSHNHNINNLIINNNQLVSIFDGQFFYSTNLSNKFNFIKSLNILDCVNDFVIYKNYLIVGGLYRTIILDIMKNYEKIETLYMPSRHCIILKDKLLICHFKYLNIIDINNEFKILKKFEIYEKNGISSIIIYKNWLITGSYGMIKINDTETFKNIKTWDFEKKIINCLITYKIYWICGSDETINIINLHNKIECIKKFLFI